MGNLCSSGTDRSEKKNEEAQLPDKPLEGEDQALLKKGVEGETVANDGGDGDAGGGGFLGNVVGDGLAAGKTAVADVVNNVEESAEKVKDNVQEEVKQGAATVEEKVKTTGNEIVETIKEKGSDLFASGKGQVDAGIKSFDDKISGEVENVETKLKDKLEDVDKSVGEAKTAVGDFGEKSVSGIKEDTQGIVGMVSNQVEDIKLDTNEVLNQGAAAMESEKPSEGGMFENVKETVSGKIGEVKETIEEKASDTKESAETWLTDAVQSAKASVVSSLPFGQGGDKGDKEKMDLSKNEEVKSNIGSEVEQLVEKSNETYEGVSALEQKGSSVLEEDYLDKAKSLLEQHRNSIDDSKIVETDETKEAESITAKSVVGSVMAGAIDRVSAEVKQNKDVKEIKVGEVPESDKPAEGSNLPEELTEKIREETARDFVEDIIDKATTIVSESISDGERDVSENINAVEAKVNENVTGAVDLINDKGDDLLEVGKKGVSFISPQISESESTSPSSTDLPSPPSATLSSATANIESEVVAGVAAGVKELASPSGSVASSISQGELVERDIELELPSPPPGVAGAVAAQSSIEKEEDGEPVIEEGSIGDEEEEEDNENKEESSTEESRPPTTEGSNDNDDEALQRVAFDITNKAVQEAIKIVTENGTGALTSDNNEVNNNSNLNNVVVNNVSNGADMTSSPSSDGRDAVRNDEEEDMMTTTNSSQVERGSSVSDLTDSSQQGSISESLSSYDPGAVFRQDLQDLEEGEKEDNSKSRTETCSPDDKDESSTSTANVSDCEKDKDTDMKFEPLSNVNAALSVDVNLLQSTGDDNGTVEAETPTPTNIASFSIGKDESVDETDVKVTDESNISSSTSPQDLPPPPPPIPTHADATNMDNVVTAISQTVEEPQQNNQPDDTTSSPAITTTDGNNSIEHKDRNGDVNDLPPPPPPPPSSSSEPASSSSTTVPSSFPDSITEINSIVDSIVSNKPTIVINSPDSAPNTNGSPDDLSPSTQTEALI